MHIKQALRKNSLFGAGQLVISSLLAFVLISVFIKIKGSELYGVFALLMVLGNVNTFSTLGLTSALIKSLSEKGKGRESDHVIIITFLILLTINIFVTLILLVFRSFILYIIFRIPEIYVDQVWDLYILLVIANSFILFGQVFNAMIDSQQKIYISQSLQTIYNVLYCGLVLIALFFNCSLTVIGLTIMISAIFWLLAIGYFSLKSWGKLTFEGLSRNYFKIIKEQISYGMQIYLGAVIGFCYEPLTKILLANFVGVTEVGFLDIGLKIRNQVWGIFIKLIYPLFPMLPQITDRAKIRLIVHDVEQKILYLIIPLIAIILCISGSLTAIWIGHNINLIGNTIAIIVSAHLLFSCTICPYYYYLIAHGLAKRIIILQAINVTGNFIIFMFTYSILGYYAIIIGNAGAIMLSFAMTLIYQKTDFNCLFFDSITQGVKLLICLSLDLFVGLVCNYFLQSDTLKIFVIPFLITITTLISYRFLYIIKPDDIYRYMGDRELLSYWGVKIFCRV